MEFNYSLNDMDMSNYYSYYIKNSKEAQKNLKKDRIKTIVYGLVLLVLFGYFFIDSEPLIIGLAIIYTVFTFMFFERTVDNKIKKLTKKASSNEELKADYENIKIIISDKGIEEITSQTYFKKWENIYSIDYVLGYTFIFLTHNSAIIIPHRELEDDELDTFDEMIEKHFKGKINYTN